MNKEDKIHINSFKFYDRDELEELTKEYYLENKQLKDKIKQTVIYIRNIAESEFINTEHYTEILNILEKSDE